MRHVDDGDHRFVIIQVAGFEGVPVVCTKSSVGILRGGAIYTRARRRHKTVEIQTETEMRALLDRAIEIGVHKRMRPFVDAWRAAGPAVAATPSVDELFEQQRSDL